MIHKLRQRLADDQRGFTLIELLIVIVIIGILIAIAVPSYLGFRDRARDNAAKSNVRAALPAVEAYYADFGNYSFTYTSLRAIDSSLPTGHPAAGSSAARIEGDADSYCISAEGKGGNGGFWKLVGPGGTITAVNGHCANANG
jgi:type IV pilus assembly protein PilA